MIAHLERSLVELAGKPREKLVRVDEMLREIDRSPRGPGSFGSDGWQLGLGVDSVNDSSR
jgi:hypothetical protein